MADWCTVDDVNAEIGLVPGQNFTADDIGAQIPKSVQYMIMMLSGKVDSAVHELWDVDAGTVPPAITDLCAKHAAIKILTKFIPGQSIADNQTLAGSLYRELKDGLTAIGKDNVFLQTSPTDTERLTTAKEKIESTRTEEDREFTSETLENF